MVCTGCGFLHDHRKKLRGLGFGLGLLLAFPSAGFGLRPSHDRVFTIAMTNLGEPNRALDQQLAALAPQGDGPYVRIGLFGDLPSYTYADPRNNWVTYPDPVRDAQSGFFEVARKRDVPIIVRTGGGPWLDPVGFSRPNAFSVLKAWRRNLMWFEDNRVHKDLTTEKDSIMTWGPNDIQVALGQFSLRLNLSRYNRESQDLRNKLRRQSAAVIGEFYRRYPHLLAGVTLDGEMGMDPDRPGHLMDYNPWSIWEFRDWITARGEYGPGGAWAGQSYVESGRYRSDLTPASDESGDGHTFNGDFGTSFASWDLRYFTAAEFEGVRNGTRKSFSLSEKVPGGFDPPRQYKNLGYANNFPAYGTAPSGADKFLKLWNYFRSFQIMNEYDAGMRAVAAAGIPAELIFNWVIPAAQWYNDRFPGDRAYGSALTTWTPRSTLGVSTGLSYYGTSDSVSSFVQNLGARQWHWTEVPGNRLMNDPKMNASVIEKYWQNKMHTMIPLVWCDNCDERIQGYPVEAALKQFIAAHRFHPWPGSGHPSAAPEHSGFSWGFPPAKPDLAGCDIPGYTTAQGFLQANLAAGSTGTILLDQRLAGATFDIAATDFDTLRVVSESSQPGTVQLIWNGGQLPAVPVRNGLQSTAFSLRQSASWSGKIAGLGLKFSFPAAASLSVYSAQIYKRNQATTFLAPPRSRSRAASTRFEVPRGMYNAIGRRVGVERPASILWPPASGASRN